MHRLTIKKKASQSYAIFRHVSVLATIIRERSQTVPGWKQRCHKAMVVSPKHVGKWSNFVTHFFKSLNSALLLDTF
jgi:hypothetical protein